MCQSFSSPEAINSERARCLGTAPHLAVQRFQRWLVGSWRGLPVANLLGVEEGQWVKRGKREVPRGPAISLPCSSQAYILKAWRWWWPEYRQGFPNVLGNCQVPFPRSQVSMLDPSHKHSNLFRWDTMYFWVRLEKDEQLGQKSGKPSVRQRVKCEKRVISVFYLPLRGPGTLSLIHCCPRPQHCPNFSKPYSIVISFVWQGNQSQWVRRPPPALPQRTPTMVYFHSLSFLPTTRSPSSTHLSTILLHQRVKDD